MRRIYLDHHSSSGPYPEVVSAMDSYWRGVCASPSGIHSAAKESLHSINEARRQICSFIGAEDGEGEIVFTGTGTEAVNLAILGFAHANQRFGKRLISSTVEHPSVLNAVQGLVKEEGFSSSLVSCFVRSLSLSNLELKTSFLNRSLSRWEFDTMD